MKIADVLRRLADTIDGHAQGAAPDPGIQNPAELLSIPTGQHIVTDAEPEEKPCPNGKTPSGNDKGPEDTFLPPLQQKQELLKKAVGVENIYDDGTATQQDEEEQVKKDVVDRIKQLSGIPAAALQELSNDEPLDD